MRLLALQLFGIAGSYASLLGVVYALKAPDQTLSWTQIGLIAASTILALVAAALGIYEYCITAPKRYTTPTAIRDYMYRWIGHQGRVAIFSHDMSWVNDDEMRDLLRRKAQSNELVICLPREIPLSQNPRAAGADVCLYPQLEYTPQARFTIVRLDRMDASVAVGRNIGGSHMIEEFSNGAHPVFAVAQDLIQILTRFNRHARQ
jgi:hypothetical protein